MKQVYVRLSAPALVTALAACGLDDRAEVPSSPAPTTSASATPSATYFPSASRSAPPLGQSRRDRCEGRLLQRIPISTKRSSGPAGVFEVRRTPRGMACAIARPNDPQARVVVSINACQHTSNGAPCRLVTYGDRSYDYWTGSGPTAVTVVAPSCLHAQAEVYRDRVLIAEATTGGYVWRDPVTASHC